jgi:hypothetical protein
MDDPLFPLLLILRYLHILGAIALMGGTIFMRFALAPAAASLGEPAKAELHEGVRSRWAKFVMLAAAMLLISGIANMVLFTSRRYDLDAVPLLNLKYGMLVGIKFLLALPIFFIASFLAGRTAAAKRFQASGVMWMNVNLTLALLMVLIGGLLKFVGRDYKDSEPPVAAVVPAESDETLPPARASE